MGVSLCLGACLAELPFLVLIPHHSVSREFCSIVRKICIYTKEEVQKMNSKPSGPRKEEGSLDGDGASEKAHLPASSDLNSSQLGMCFFYSIQSPHLPKPTSRKHGLHDIVVCYRKHHPPEATDRSDVGLGGLCRLC